MREVIAPKVEILDYRELSGVCPLCAAGEKYPVLETEEAWWCVCLEHGIRWAIQHFGWGSAAPSHEVARRWAKTWEFLESLTEVCVDCGDTCSHTLEGPAHCSECGGDVCPACRAPYYPVYRRPDLPVPPPECMTPTGSGGKQEDSLS